jgi:hypothetical protein
MAMLGFGCQFIDGDLDGAEDLILTNGHVFDMSYRGVPYAMRAQFFRNRGDGQFDELHAETAGEFFRDSRLGRGLARIDWNRDGRDDAAISHLDAPAALLTNVGPAGAQSLALHLHGVESNRDAIGAVVSVTVGGRTLVRQLSAGDGYHASNERRLTFGLGVHKSIEKLEIHWPSGRRQSFDNPPPAVELACVEGAPQLAAIAR